jgi:hypothetical protein
VNTRIFVVVAGVFCGLFASFVLFGGRPRGRSAILDAPTGPAKPVRGTVTGRGRDIPKFSTPQDAAIVTAPGAPGYDPTRFLGVMMARDIFRGEARNPAWAEPMEQGLLSTAEEEVQKAIPELEALQVECRTTVCQFRWKAPPAAMAKVGGYLLGLYSGSGGDVPSSGTFTTVFAGGQFRDVPQGDAAAALARVRELRPKRLRGIRFQTARGLNPYPSVPLEAWPQE